MGDVVKRSQMRKSCKNSHTDNNELQSRKVQRKLDRIILLSFIINSKSAKMKNILSSIGNNIKIWVIYINPIMFGSISIWYDEHNSKISKHKIILDGLTCY